jgi:hypothetical protein
VFGEVGYQCISKPNLVAGSPDGCSSQSLPSMAPVVKGQMPVWEQGHPSVAPSRLLDGNENCPSPGCAGAVQYRMHTPGHASRHDIKLASGVSRPLIDGCGQTRLSQLTTRKTSGELPVSGSQKVLRQAASALTTPEAVMSARGPPPTHRAVCKAEMTVSGGQDSPSCRSTRAQRHTQATHLTS